MKILSIFILSLIALQLKAQENISGEYQSFTSFSRSTLKINLDSTYLYKVNFHLSSSWTKGKWKIQNDTIYFATIPVYDTLVWSLTEFDGSSKKNLSTLVLSVNENSENISYSEYLEGKKFQGKYGQNNHPAPVKLFLQKDRLYLLDEKGKPIKKRFKGINNRKYGTWFFRKEKK